MTPPIGRDGDFFPASRPLPADGIRARSQRGPIGEEWWSRRFIAALEALGVGGRMQRGRTYARKGQVLSLDVGAGRVSARVQGSRPSPYDVTIRVQTLTDADWDRVEAAMAARAVFIAKLLAGEMPRDIEDAFARCSLSLFPGRRRDLTTDCSCPDWANPCKHIAAVFYLLAERFDDDPFLILVWRGRDKRALLADLRARRGAAATPPPEAKRPEPAPDPARFWAAGPELVSVRPRLEAAGAPAAILQTLDLDDETRRRLEPAYTRIRDEALRVAERGVPPA